ncbi:adenylate/guanylate cyclase with integral membrane sensor [Pelomyxa schiedti]|nr:adenylate/guanylate cyclase with integral membrane sensor [Pelomyxa schiedti]
MFQRTTKVSDLSLLSDTARRMAQKHPCHFSVRSVLIVFLLSSLLLTVAPVMVLWTLASQAGLEKTTSALYENIVGDITTFVNTFIEDATVTLVQNSNIVKVSPEICTDPVAYENLWRLLAANSLTLSNSIYTGNPYECLVGARSLPDKTMMIQCNSTGFDWIACNFETEPVVETTMCISWGQGYRPTLKQWYQLPVEAGFNVVTWTPFYNFYSTLGIGFTVSVAVPDPANTQRLCAVFALDYQMFVLQNFFQNLSVAKTGWALMFEASGGFLIASGNENVPVIINDTRTSLWDLSTQEARDIAEILYSDFGEEVTAVFSPQGIFHCRGDVAGQVVDLTIKSERFASTLDDWVIVSVVPSADYFTRQKDTLIITACSATGIFLVLGFIVIGASFCLTTPIKYVSRELEALSRLDEGAMSKATIGPGNTIKESKKKVGLREIESLEESAESVRLMLASFGKYVPMEVVKWYLNGTAECKLGVRRRQCSILFCDIEDFSRLTEQVPPELMIALFTRFMDICHNAIQIENGIVDKIVGDEIMV